MINNPFKGRLTQNRHFFPIRVYFEDTDAGGVVYHARYFHYAERARTEMLRLAGFEHVTMMAQDCVVIAVRRCSANFLKPAVLDDLLEVRTWISEIKGASLIMAQNICRDDADLVKIELTLVCLNLASKKPIRLPCAIRNSFQKLISTKEG